jgi:hypothetical protein
MFEQHRDTVANRIRAMRNLSSSMVVAAAVLLLGACGGSAGGSASTTSKAGATSAARPGVSTTTSGAGSLPSRTGGEEAVSALHGGFHTIIPRGYRNGLAARGGGASGAEYQAIGPKADGLGDILTVFRIAAGSAHLAAIADRALRNLSRQPAFLPQASRISSLQSLSVDGEPALALDYRVTGLKMQYRRQVFVVHGAWAYEISDAAAPSRHSASLRALDDLIRAWRWQ